MTRVNIREDYDRPVAATCELVTGSLGYKETPRHAPCPVWPADPGQAPVGISMSSSRREGAHA